MIHIMHHHIFKNAGTTIDWVLQRNFPNQVLHVESLGSGVRLSNQQVMELSADKPQYCCATSHAVPLPLKAWAQCHLVLLRDPIERFYSMYKFGLTHKDDSLNSKRARSMSYKKYLTTWLDKGSAQSLNWQTKCCTPQSDENMQKHKGWYGNLAAAKQTISQNSLAATVKQFDGLMLLLEEHLNKHNIAFDGSYMRQNISHDKKPSIFNFKQWGRGNKISESLYQRFKEANHLDYELVDYVESLAADKLDKLDPNGEKMNEFASRCEQLKAQNPEVVVPSHEQAYKL